VVLYWHLHLGRPSHHLGVDWGRNHLSLEIRRDLSEREGQILPGLFPSERRGHHERSLELLLVPSELVQQREQEQERQPMAE
jgi:hypothetical protein